MAEAVLAGHKPAIWVSDLYGGQRSHGTAWQICLAHQLHDCQYTIEAGDHVFAPSRATSTWAMAGQPTNTHCKHLRKRSGKDRDSLLTFITERAVPPANNSFERHIRPPAIFRKVTNGFRSDCGGDLHAAVR